MKFVNYTADGNLVSVYEIKNPMLVGNKLVFDGGEAEGLTDRHVLLNDDVNPPETLDEAKELDQLGSLSKKSTKVEQLEQENEDLRSRTAYLEDALLILMDLI